MQKKSIVGFVLGLAGLGLIAVWVQAGNLEPGTAPGPTMRPLDELSGAWCRKLPASERFVVLADFGSAAVLDKETGLVWEQSPGTGAIAWVFAKSQCYFRTVGNRWGWRLPTIEELASLVEPTQTSPALPMGHPFANVQLDIYWSATTNDNTTTSAWVMGMAGGGMGVQDKGIQYHAWCVRGGRGHDASY